MSDAGPAAVSRRRWVFLIPLVVFAALAGIFLIRLESGGDTDFIPSALGGKPAPEFALAPLDPALPGLKRADLLGQVTVVNIFASWCVPCRDEHPQLQKLAAAGNARLVGIDYKDAGDNARRFLGELGNPYSAIGVDAAGRAAIDWGVYGVPETFIVSGDGIIRFKKVGPISDEDLTKVILPEIEKARG